MEAVGVAAGAWLDGVGAAADAADAGEGGDGARGRCACACPSAGAGACGASTICAGTIADSVRTHGIRAHRIRAIAPAELGREALRHERHIVAPPIQQGQFVGGREPAGGPRGPPEIDVRVLVQEVEGFAHVRQAICVGPAAAQLGHHGLTPVLAQEIEGGCEAVADFVGDAVGGGAAAAVEVVVEIVDQALGVAAGVGHFEEGGGGAVGDGSAGGGPIAA